MASRCDNTESLCWSKGDLRRLTNEQLKLMKPRLQIETAFDHFNITDPSFLEKCDGRSRCTSCGQSRKYFCYTCYQSLDQFRDRTPRVQLPCRVDILKHPREIAGKSTAVHAPILAPDHATVYTHPDIPDYRTLNEKVILIFPGPRSQKLEDYFAEHSNSQRCCTCSGRDCNQDCSCPAAESSGLPFDRAVLIDCTWNQVKRIVLDERVSGLPRVEISSHQTLFWRYQTGKPATYLATIEALYYFILAVHKLQKHSPTKRPGLQTKAGEEREGTTEVTVCEVPKSESPLNENELNEYLDECSSTDAKQGKVSGMELLSRENSICADGDIQTQKRMDLANESLLQYDSACNPLPTLEVQDNEGSSEALISANQQGVLLTMDTEPGQHASVDHVLSNYSEVELPLIGEGCDTARLQGKDLDATPCDLLRDDFEGIKISENKQQDLHRETCVDEEIKAPRKESALLIKDDKGLYTDTCCHQYDNMLFFFKFMFYKIHNLYGSNNLRAYK